MKDKKEQERERMRGRNTQRAVEVLKEVEVEQLLQREETGAEVQQSVSGQTASWETMDAPLRPLITDEGGLHGGKQEEGVLWP